MSEKRLSHWLSVCGLAALAALAFAAACGTNDTDVVRPAAGSGGAVAGGSGALTGGSGGALTGGSSGAAGVASTGGAGGSTGGGGGSLAGGSGGAAQSGGSGGGAQAGSGGAAAAGGAGTGGGGRNDAATDAGGNRNDAATDAGGGRNDAATDTRSDRNDAAIDAGGTADAGAGPRVLGGYYPNWTSSPVRIRDIDANYNLVYLFAAVPVGGPPGTTGAVSFDLPGDGRGARTNFTADIQYARTVQGRKIILSVGGAGNGMSFPTRTKSQTFVDSVVALYKQFGPFDGLDWNTFEADQAPDTAEMIWMSLELKRLYPGFWITAPPAPWNARDRTFCQAMVQAGAMDYAAPQYYDGPGLDVPSYVVGSINEWVTLLGPTHVVVGFGVGTAANYMTVAEVVTSWNQIKVNHPTIRGAFNWQIHSDEAAGWAFAKTLGPLVNP